MKRSTLSIFVIIVLFGSFLLLSWLTVSGPFSSNASSLQAKLQNEVETKLSDANLTWAKVALNGQQVTLSGNAPSDEALAKIEDVALRAAGRGGFIWGGVIYVNNEVIVQFEPTPYDLVIDLESDSSGEVSVVQLSGELPNATIRAEIRNLLRRKLDPSGIKSDIVLAEHRQSGPWHDALLDILPHFLKMDEGELHIADKSLKISGKARESVLDSIKNGYLRHKNKGSKLNLTMVEKIDPPLPEISAIPISNNSTNDFEPCQRAFNAVMDVNFITFDSGTAMMTEGSHLTLDKVLTVARMCSSYGLTVAGHTDNVGSRDRNVSLSLKRAKVISSYLNDKQYTNAEIEAIGKGPDEPKFSNDTIQGRERNSRIEFIILNKG